MGRLKILVVDDDALNLEVAELILRAAGHDVRTCTNGEDAVHLARLEHFDAILLDLRMPVLDGVETARRLREQPETQGTALLLITGHPDLLVPGGEEAGLFDAILRKPYQRRQLLDTLAGLHVRAPGDLRISFGPPPADAPSEEPRG